MVTYSLNITENAFSIDRKNGAVSYKAQAEIHDSFPGTERECFEFRWSMSRVYLNPTFNFSSTKGFKYGHVKQFFFTTMVVFS